MSDTPSILVPLDGSTGAEHAVPVAAAIARLKSASVHLLHVADKDGVDTPAQLAQVAENFTKYGHELATKNRLSPDCEAGGSCVQVTQGNPAEVILDASEGAEMIVIASHGRGGFQAAIIGSVTDKVVRGARVPVLVVPAIDEPRPLTGRPVLIALDGSEGAEKGLALGRELAALLGSPVTLVRSYSIPPPVGVEFAYYPADLLETLQSSTSDYLNATVKPGEKSLMAQGYPAQVIVSAADEIDAGLVVMTSTGKGRAARIALGSATDRVLHSLKRSLLIVPSKDEK